MTIAVLLRSGMTRKCHVPFWRAVGKVTFSLTLIILERAREGHSQSNATGLATSTFLGASLVEQVARMNVESQCL
jgi:hypothetical protein